MTISDWLKNKGTYSEGVALYASLEKHNPNYLKIFEKRETPHNRMKLKYELQNHLKSVTKQSTVKQPKAAPGPVTTYQASKYSRKILINELPVALHPLYIKQKSDFTLACSLKLQLNSIGHQFNASGGLIIGSDGLPRLKRLTASDERKALELALKIEDLFDAVDKTWEIIDHYLEHNIVLEVQENDFNNYSEVQVMKKILSIRSGLTRQNQRLEQQQQLYDNSTVDTYKNKYLRNIEKAKQKIFQFEQDLIKLHERKEQLKNEHQ